jgi:hypothetical protein
MHAGSEQHGIREALPVVPGKCDACRLDLKLRRKIPGEWHWNGISYCKLGSLSLVKFSLGVRLKVEVLSFGVFLKWSETGMMQTWGGMFACTSNDMESCHLPTW